MQKKAEFKANNKNNIPDLETQRIIQELCDLGYPNKNILLNSSFWGYNGQTFLGDIIVLPENSVLHINPILVIKIIDSLDNFNAKLLEKWQYSGSKVLIFKQKDIIRVFALDNNNQNYYEISPFIPHFKEIENLPNPDYYRLKSSLSPGYNLKSILANLHDHLYGNSNIRIPSRLGIEIQKILLIKKFDEEQVYDQCEFCLTGKELYKKYDDQITPNLDPVNQVAERIKNLLHKYNLNKDDCHQIRSLELDNESIYYTVFHLEGISLTQTPSDVLGDALETFRSYIMKREGGQFFTPRPVIELALNLVGFTGENHQTLADISCGTSGFLHQARKIIIKSAEKKGILDQFKQNQLISDLLLGLEVDQYLVQISNTSPELEKLPQKIVENQDSLLPFQQWKSQLLDRISPNSKMFMVGNPPFGTKITIKNLEILQSFQLARSWKKHQDQWISTEKIVPRSPDILFIERNLDLLKHETGKMVLVFPYQILSGPQEEFVREWLMTHCKIIAVIDLPEDTFQPYTGTKGALLVVQKREKPNPLWENEPEYPIFMARPIKIGHDRRGKPVFKDDQQTIVDIDLPEISQAYEEFLKANDPSKVTKKAFIISSKSITHSNNIRLNAAYYEPKSSNLKQQLVTIREQNPDFTISTLGELIETLTRFY
ncbi:hypothetical protein NO976_03262 [Planktothrix agardhii]|jgi:type I restriction enzyme M protein|uniref:Uncharacterized protein n=1 Tax=Planktothrix agardhii TaxID=1160 RepID=A0A1J1JBA6_PLAAG|nr:N-6 DNA methylase [Planktothrix agardhii]MCF3607101.1 N-6 DNA methylase [Planktothrix agardhii 1033]MCF3575838.1 N-6 DNA methylase [Planktothrix agardhii 1812]MCF3580362.1 N-6 DNA methylase [Planktothrix agardhii 1811]MCF3624940.1 N-6 DNA methylase [Planktothrix agardhii 1801]CAD5912044.1 hypothetical protein NO365_00103 [Planktothrix agardhii]